MKLIYKIEYNSTSFYFKRLIDELIKNSNIDANTKQYFGFILIFIDDELENIEKDILLNALNLTHWNRTLAAKKLGMSFRSLRYRLKKFGLDTDEE